LQDEFIGIYFAENHYRIEPIKRTNGVDISDNQPSIYSCTECTRGVFVSVQIESDMPKNENQIDIPKKEPVLLNTTELQIGNTIYVISDYQSENAKETVEEKLIRLMRRRI